MQYNRERRYRHPEWVTHHEIIWERSDLLFFAPILLWLLWRRWRV